jgi:hypothetical protein
MNYSGMTVNGRTESQTLRRSQPFIARRDKVSGNLFPANSFFRIAAKILTARDDAPLDAGQIAPDHPHP